MRVYYSPNVENYYAWLLNKIVANGDTDYVERYSKLLDLLFSIPFRWSIDKDINRAHDGLDLRSSYMMQTNLPLPLTKECSVLEMLIALILKCDKDILGDIDGVYIQQWVDTLITNLNLSYFDDDHFNREDATYFLDVWLDRRYSYDGTGGLFPLERPFTDQRETEIWWQMQSYVLERFPL